MHGLRMQTDEDLFRRGPDSDEDEGSGDEASGDEGSGDESSGNKASGDEGSGDEGSGDKGSGDEASGDEGSGDEGSGDGDKASGDEGSGDESSGDESSGDEASGDKGSNNKGSDDEAAGDKGSDEKGSVEKGSDEKGSDEKGSDEKGSDEKGSDEKGSDDEAAGDKGSDEKGSDDEAAGDKGSDEKGSDDETSGDEASGDAASEKDTPGESAKSASDETDADSPPQSPASVSDASDSKPSSAAASTKSKKKKAPSSVKSADEDDDAKLDREIGLVPSPKASAAGKAASLPTSTAHAQVTDGSKFANLKIILGASIGGVVFLMLLAFLIMFCIRLRRKKKDQRRSSATVNRRSDMRPVERDGTQSAFGPYGGVARSTASTSTLVSTTRRSSKSRQSRPTSSSQNSERTIAASDSGSDKASLNSDNSSVNSDARKSNIATGRRSVMARSVRFELENTQQAVKPEATAPAVDTNTVFRRTVEATRTAPLVAEVPQFKYTPYRSPYETKARTRASQSVEPRHISPELKETKPPSPPPKERHVTPSISPMTAAPAPNSNVALSLASISAGPYASEAYNNDLHKSRSVKKNKLPASAAAIRNGSISSDYDVTSPVAAPRKQQFESKPSSVRRRRHSSTGDEIDRMLGINPQREGSKKVTDWGQTSPYPSKSPTLPKFNFEHTDAEKRKKAKELTKPQLFSEAEEQLRRRQERRERRERRELRGKELRELHLPGGHQYARSVPATPLVTTINTTSTLSPSTSRQQGPLSPLSKLTSSAAYSKPLPEKPTSRSGLVASGNNALLNLSSSTLANRAVSNSSSSPRSSVRSFNSSDSSDSSTLASIRSEPTPQPRRYNSVEERDRARSAERNRRWQERVPQLAVDTSVGGWRPRAARRPRGNYI